MTKGGSGAGHPRKSLASRLGEELYLRLGMMALVVPLVFLGIMALTPFGDHSEGADRSMNLHSSVVYGGLAAPAAFGICAVWYWCGRRWRLPVLGPKVMAWITAILTVIWLVGLLWQVIR